MDFYTFDKWMQFVMSETKELRQRAHARPLGSADPSDEALRHLITTTLSSINYLFRIDHPYLLQNAANAFADGEGIMVGQNKPDGFPRKIKSTAALYKYLLELRG